MTMGEWSILPCPAAAQSTRPGSTSRGRLTSMPGVSSRTPSASARRSSPGRCACSLRKRWRRTSGRRVWHSSQELCERQAGSLEVRLETSERKELTRWILSWMPHGMLSGSLLRTNVRTACENECARDWLNANDAPSRRRYALTCRTSAPHPARQAWYIEALWRLGRTQTQRLDHLPSTSSKSSSKTILTDAGGMVPAMVRG